MAEGKGIALDDACAVKLFEHAARLGHADARQRLGRADARQRLGRADARQRLGHADTRRRPGRVATMDRLDAAAPWHGKKPRPPHDVEYVMRCGASDLSDLERGVCAERAREATAHDYSEIAALTSWLLQRHPHWLDPTQPIDTVLRPPRLDLDHWLRVYSDE